MNLKNIVQGRPNILLFLLTMVLVFCISSCNSGVLTQKNEPTLIPRIMISAGNANQLSIIAKMPDGGNTVLFSPNGNVLATLVYNTVNLYDVDTQEQLASLEASYGISDLFFHPDGNSIIVLSVTEGKSLIQQWKLSDYSEMFDFSNIDLSKMHVLAPTLAISPDGNWLAFDTCDEYLLTDNFSYCSVGGITLQNISSDSAATESLRFCDLSSFRIVQDTEFSPDGALLAIGSIGSTNSIGYDYGEVNICNLNADNKVDGLWAEFGSHPMSIAFSPDGKTLAAGMNDGKIFLFDVATRQSLQEFGNNSGMEIRSIAFSSDGNLLISANNYGKVVIWNLESGNSIATLNDGSIYELSSVDISPNNTLIASMGSNYESLRLWGLPIE